MTAEPTTALQTREAPELTPFEVIERVISSGDLSKMDAPSRVAFYWRTCESLGLNPLTRPFEFIVLDGKMTLYARKDATDQLRAINRVSITSLRSERDQALDLLTVYARGRTPDGREEESSGVVSIKGFSGQALANLFMKAETKAKRRLTLSLVGLGFLDESEVEGAVTAADAHTGELTDGTAAAEAPASLLETIQRQTEALGGTAPEAPAAAAAPEAPAAEEAVEADFTPAEEPVPEAPAETPAQTPPAEEAAAPEAPAEVPAAPAEEAPALELQTMTVEDSAAIAEESEDELLELAHEAPAKELTIQQLAEMARAAGAGKRAFASAIDCPPADVSARIEAMTDAQRYALAAGMGLLGGGA